LREIPYAELVPFLILGDGPPNQEVPAIPVAEVTPGGLLYKAGLRAGDLVTRVNGLCPEDSAQSMERLWELSYGMEP
ncbi:unnamed protein product, partial [Discosporangium mesarthrocarpum]